MKNSILIILITLITAFFILFFFKLKEEGAKKIEKQFDVISYFHSTDCTKITPHKDLTISELAKLHNINLFEGFKNIQEKSFHEQEVCEIILLDFGQRFQSTEQILSQMDSAGYRPATLRELVSLNTCATTRYDIVALGSSYNGFHPCSFCVCDDNNTYEIRVMKCNSESLRETYDDLIRFAAVKL